MENLLESSTYHSYRHGRHEYRLDPEQVLKLMRRDQEHRKLDEPIQEVRDHAGSCETSRRRKVVWEHRKTWPNGSEHLDDVRDGWP
jgi:hypothetical protein